MTENQLLGLIRQYGSKEEALKQMPAIDLLLNDKSAYSEKGRIETISGVIDRSTGTVSLRAVFPNEGGLLHSGQRTTHLRINLNILPTANCCRIRAGQYPVGR